MNATDLHVILERLCNLLRVEARVGGAAHGLLPVQVEALHYLSRCNRYSDTVVGLAEFLGQTKGTVSQTVKVLETRGLLRREDDARDRRLVHLRLTGAGREALATLVPAPPLARALDAVPEAHRVGMADGLRDLLGAAQRANRMRSFAACQTCRFNEPDGDGFRCGLTGESLAPAEVVLICREHQHPTPGG